MGCDELWFWDLTTGQRTATVAIGSNRVGSMSLIAAGRASSGSPNVGGLDAGEFHGVTRLNAHALSPDGATLATAREHGAVELFDTASWRSLASASLGHAARRLAFSPDGHLLAVGDDRGTAHLWDASLAARVASVNKEAADPYDTVQEMGFSPDGSMLVTATRGTGIVVWDVAALRERLSIDCRGWSFLFSPDSRTLALGDGKLIDTPSGRVIDRLPFSGAPLALSPDGRRLACAGCNTALEIWDLPSRTCADRLETKTWWIQSVRYTPDGRWVAVGSWGEGDASPSPRLRGLGTARRSARWNDDRGRPRASGGTGRPGVAVPGRLAPAPVRSRMIWHPTPASALASGSSIVATRAGNELRRAADDRLRR